MIESRVCALDNACIQKELVKFLTPTICIKTNRVALWFVYFVFKVIYVVFWVIWIWGKLRSRNSEIADVCHGRYKLRREGYT